MSFFSYITSVDSVFTLVAFSGSLTVTYLIKRLKHKENLLTISKKKDLANDSKNITESGVDYLSQFTGFFSVDTSQLTREQKYSIIIEQLKEKRRNLSIVLGLILIITITSALVILTSIFRGDNGSPIAEYLSSYAGETKTLDLRQIPDTSLEKSTHEVKNLEEFLPQGGVNLRYDSNSLKGFFEGDLIANESGGYYKILINKEVSGRFYYTANISADKRVGTIELVGLGSENRSIHFIIDHKQSKYFIWQGEDNVQIWKDLPFKLNDGANQFSMMQDGRYVVLYINNKFVSNFTINENIHTGRIGIVFKRERLLGPSMPDLSENQSSALVNIFGVKIYDFLK